MKIGRTRIPTGSSDYTKANNIYDLAGNVYDWTMEAVSANGRGLRGGNYDFDGAIDPQVTASTSIRAIASAATVAGLHCTLSSYFRPDWQCVPTTLEPEA